MKYKVAQLEGALLDAAVAKALGYRFELGHRMCLAAVPDLEHGDGNGLVGFQPSTDWEQGGPFIEREASILEADSDGWRVTVGTATEFHSLLLVAFCRAKVASKFGDEIDLPLDNGTKFVLGFAPR